VGKEVARAFLRMSADDQFTARLNGTELGGGEDWRVAQQFNDIARLLKPRANELEITAVNNPATGANPAGLIAALEIEFADGGALRINSDAEWRCSKTEAAAEWTNAIIAARYGEGPWGEIDGSDDGINGPQSTGIPDRLRLIYVPRAEPVLLHNLPEAGGRGTVAWWFDPVTGNSTTLGFIFSDNQGNGVCPPPSGLSHDWVLILQMNAGRD
jgi:hypothetical protein